MTSQTTSPWSVDLDLTATRRDSKRRRQDETDTTSTSRYDEPDATFARARPTITALLYSPSQKIVQEDRFLQLE